MSATPKENSLESYIQAVIFDLDGTLVSSSLDFALIRRELGCPVNTDILDFIAELDEQQKQDAHKIVHKHECRDASETVSMPGAKALLDELAWRGIQTGIVTRNSLRTTTSKLETSGLSFAHIVTRECAPAKPKPDGLLQLATRWNIEPERCIYVGDYLYDIQAAHNAGMHACLYAPFEQPDYASQADFICRDFDRFIENMLPYLSLKIS